MRDLGHELLEATLAVGNFGAEQILMVTVECVALEVFVGSVSHGDGGAGQDILNAPAEAGMFPLRGVQSLLDGAQYGVRARPVGFGVSFRRARPEAAVAESSNVVVYAVTQERLKHFGVSSQKRW